jgi:hypothetical protein
MTEYPKRPFVVVKTINGDEHKGYLASINPKYFRLANNKTDPEVIFVKIQSEDVESLQDTLGNTIDIDSLSIPFKRQYDRDIAHHLEKIANLLFYQTVITSVAIISAILYVNKNR